MKIVWDTNVLVAAFIAHGACNELLEHCALHYEIILSDPILKEFRNVLVRKFGFSQAEVHEASQLLLSKAFWVEPTVLSAPVARDRDDDLVIATAIAGQCFCIVSGDKDLTEIGEYQGVRIITPSDFWQYEETLV